MLAHVFLNNFYWHACQIDEKSTVGIKEQAIFDTLKNADDACYTDWLAEQIEYIRENEDEDFDSSEVVEEYKIDEDGDFVVRNARGEWECVDFDFQVFTSRDILEMALDGEADYLNSIYLQDEESAKELVDDLISQQEPSELEEDFEVYCSINESDESEGILMRKVDGKLVELDLVDMMNLALNGKAGYLKSFIQKQKDRDFIISFSELIEQLDS